MQIRHVGLASVLVLFACGFSTAATVFVDDDAAACGDGQSWATAYKHLQDALTAARNSGGTITEIWVAAGTYRPDRSCANPAGTGDRNASFQLISGVALRGGFAGNEDPATFDRSTRDFDANTTTLSGDLAGDDRPGFLGYEENVHHVVTANAVGPGTVLDGLTITGGNATVTGDDSGGGLKSLYSDLSLNRCRFVANRASRNGGGASSVSGTLQLAFCVFDSNAAIDGGGGIYLYASDCELFTCVISRGSGIHGAGIYSALGNLKVSSSTLNENQSGAVYALQGLVTVDNSILYGSADLQLYVSGTKSVTHSCVVGIAETNGNIKADPRLLSDGRVRRDSPCIDAGNNTLVPPDTATDFAGRARFVDDPNTPDSGVAGEPPRPVVDMGAYEFVPGPERRAYVRASAPSGGDGTTWATAYRFLQDALQNDPYVTEVWVAAGTYRPDQDSNYPEGTRVRTTSFEPPDRMRMYGGFPGQPGQEDQFDLRDPDEYPTVLSGDLSGDDGPDFVNRTDNSYHVMQFYSVGPSTIVDGFHITGGNGNGGLSYEGAGGMNLIAASLTIANCTFAHNSGKFAAGVFAYKGNLAMANCNFIANSATGGGGGMIVSECNLAMTNCRFIANSAIGGGGGMACKGPGTTSLLNCLFASNTAEEGGGLFNYSGTASLTNCTLVANSTIGAVPSGAIKNLGSLTVTNTVAWGTIKPIDIAPGTATVTYSCVQGGWPGTGNISADPQVRSDNTLATTSPCIDAGDNTALAADLTFDLGGGLRFLDVPTTPDTGKPGVPARPVVDMGAYEFQVNQPKRLYVNRQAPAGGDGRSWATAYQFLRDALQEAASNVVDEIWVAEGTYTPDRDAAHPAGTGDRAATFLLVSGVPIYGGFPGQPGQENDFSFRNARTHETILSGDLAGDDGTTVTVSNVENSYHVVTGMNQAAGTVWLDGVTISGGNANGSGTDAHGGGLYGLNAGSTLANCTLRNNAALGQGGGAWITGETHVVGCQFLANRAATGAGLYAGTMSVTVHGCLFAWNATSETGSGGGVYGSPLISNCTLVANTAATGGGWLCGRGGKLRNSICWGNSATLSGPQISGSANVTYSCSQGGWSGTGNISSDPLFVDPANGDYRLAAGSPCIDAGNNTDVPGDVLTDLLGLPRFFDNPGTSDCRWVPGTCGAAPIVDMGAYEFVILPGDFDNDLDVDVDDLEAFILCASGPALPYAEGCAGADFDADLDVDSADFGPMQRCFSGAGTIADPACAE